MGLSEFLRDTSRTLKLIKKPEKRDLMLTLKVIGIGLLVLGLTGFVFQLAGSAMRSAPSPRLPRDLMLIITGAVLAVILALVVYVRRRGL